MSSGQGSEFTSIDTGGFDEVINRLDSLCSEFNTQREALFSKAGDLISGGWEGQGAEAFKKSYENIKRYFDDDHESLQNVLENLRKIKDTYMRFDAEVARKIEETILGGGTSSSGSSGRRSAYRSDGGK